MATTSGTLRTLIALSFVLLAAPGAVAAEPQRLVAVLPFSAPPAAGLDEQAKLSFEETIRTVAGDLLTPKGYVVLTGETTLTVLADNAIDPQKACDASCALEAARELKASYFVSGSLSIVEGIQVAFVRLYDQNGRQLASVKLEGESARQVRTQFEEGAASFFSAIPAVAVPQSQALQFHLSPPLSSSATGKWTLRDRTGATLCDLPCVRWVSGWSGYTLRFDAERGEELRIVRIPDTFKQPWGSAVTVKPVLKSRSALLHPTWLFVAAPLAIGAPLMGVGSVVFGSVSESRTFLLPALLFGVTSLAMGIGSTYWSYRIIRNWASSDAVEIEPLAER